MRPVLFTWRRAAVPSYPFFAWLGLSAALVAQNVAASAAGLPAGRIWLASLVLVPLAFIGARLLYAWSHRTPGERVWRRSAGGMSMYGGLPPMLVASVPLLLLLGVPFLAFWDTAMIGIFAATPLLRVGCLLHGCCAGRPARGPLCMRLPDHRGVRVSRVPSQALEMALGLVLLVTAAVVWTTDPAPGLVFLGGVAGYALGRLALQPLRADRTRSAGLDVPLVISGALAVGAILALVVGLGVSG